MTTRKSIRIPSLRCSNNRCFLELNGRRHYLGEWEGLFSTGRVNGVRLAAYILFAWIDTLHNLEYYTLKLFLHRPKMKHKIFKPAALSIWTHSVSQATSRIDTSEQKIKATDHWRKWLTKNELKDAIEITERQLHSMGRGAHWTFKELHQASTINEQARILRSKAYHLPKDTNKSDE